MRREEPREWDVSVSNGLGDSCFGGMAQKSCSRIIMELLQALDGWKDEPSYVRASPGPLIVVIFSVCRRRVCDIIPQLR
jgi:hypothetical protein